MRSFRQTSVSASTNPPVTAAMLSPVVVPNYNAINNVLMKKLKKSKRVIVSKNKLHFNEMMMSAFYWTNKFIWISIVLAH